jgi:hypothetical protein
MAIRLYRLGNNNKKKNPHMFSTKAVFSNVFDHTWLNLQMWNPQTGKLIINLLFLFYNDLRKFFDENLENTEKK